MNMHQLRVEVHDMGNLLMRLGVYSEKKDIPRIQSTVKVVLDCFEQIKHEVYSISGGSTEGMASISMMERFLWLEQNVPRLEEVYNVKIHLDCGQCNPDDRIFVPIEAPATVFSNAIQNASKAGATEIKVTYDSSPYYVSISYTDNGKGMSKETLDNLGFKGDGQGVNLIRRLVHASGGTCSWESEEGKGTRLTVKLRKDQGSCFRPK